jgi:hypothetical protein
MDLNFLFSVKALVISRLAAVRGSNTTVSKSESPKALSPIDSTVPGIEIVVIAVF